MVEEEEEKEEEAEAEVEDEEDEDDEDCHGGGARCSILLTGLSRQMFASISSSSSSSNPSSSPSITIGEFGLLCTCRFDVVGGCWC